MKSLVMTLHFIDFHEISCDDTAFHRLFQFQHMTPCHPLRRTQTNGRRPKMIPCATWHHKHAEETQTTPTQEKKQCLANNNSVANESVSPHTNRRNFNFHNMFQGAQNVRLPSTYSGGEVSGARAGETGSLNASEVTLGRSGSLITAFELPQKVPRNFPN